MSLTKFKMKNLSDKYYGEEERQTKDEAEKKVKKVVEKVVKKKKK